MFPRILVPRSRGLAALAGRQAARFCASACDVVRGGDAGLLLRPACASAAASAPPLASGSVVKHQGESFVCVFRVDAFWFAAPLSGAAKSARWFVGQPPEGASHPGVACLQRPTPTQQQREPLSEGIPTGLIGVDTLSPLGRGQSMLVCGPQGSGKSTLAREILEHALTTRLVDHALRFRTDTSAPIVDAVLQRSGAFAELATDAQGAALLGPLFEAVGVAEALRDSGRHALLVIDTIAPLVEAWRLARRWAEEELGRALDTEAAGAQRRGCFAGLLERAACLTTKRDGGGGSLTLLILAETDEMAGLGASAAAKAAKAGAASHGLEAFQGRKASEIARLEGLVKRGVPLTDGTLAALGIAPPSAGEGVPEEAAAMRELQSLSDGQVVLDGAVAAAGDFPALDPGATFSRFGLGSYGQSQTAEPSAARQRMRDVRPPALQAVAAHLRTELALERDARFRPQGSTPGAVLDGELSGRLRVVRAALLQPERAPMSPDEMTLVLLAACGGALDALPEEEAAAALRGGSASPLLRHLREGSPQLFTRLAEEQSMSKAAARELEVAVRLFVALKRASPSV